MQPLALFLGWQIIKFDKGLCDSADRDAGIVDVLDWMGIGLLAKRQFARCVL